MERIQHEVTLTADSADALANTPLDRAPGPGAVAIYLASTVADTQASVIVGPRVLKYKSVIGKVIANAQIDVNADTPLTTRVRSGQKLLIDIDVVSAATVRVMVVWMGIA